MKDIKYVLLPILIVFFMLVLQFCLSFIFLKGGSLDFETQTLVISIIIDFAFLIAIIFAVKLWNFALFDCLKFPKFLSLILISLIGLTLSVFFSFLPDFSSERPFLLNYNLPNLKLLNKGTEFNYSLIRSIFIVPILEELFYRKIIFSKINEKFSLGLSLLISSLLFAVAHLDINQAVPALIIGGLLGYIYYKTKNIIVPILIHSLYNFFVQISEKSVFGFQAIVFIVLLFLVFFAIKKLIQIESE